MVAADVKNSLVPILASVVLGIFLRWVVAIFPYSGEGKPPKFGDFEAQRHWMEITVNLPMNEWYRNTSRNDLEYWGLDYPPLSAYHSFALGKVFKSVLPASVRLGTSRGFESAFHKFLMRFSVSISDLLIPAIVLFHVALSRTHKYAAWLPVLVSLVAPPFIMVDYGHFQYNCVSLGLTVLAALCLLYDQTAICSLFFTLAVHHKQMSLFHAIPFFCHLTGTLIMKRVDLLSTFRVAVTILSTLGLMWLPFGDYWIYPFQRMFPLQRGVYEDKVGSFWYALDRVYPLKKNFVDEQMAKICAAVTVMFLLPSAIHHFRKACQVKVSTEDMKKIFLLSLFNGSLICFLFSYHVHEKSILLPCLAAIMLIPWYPFQSIWFITVASFSLYPLFYQERSHVALLCLTGFFILVAEHGSLLLSLMKGALLKLAFIASVGGYLAIIFGTHFVPAPGKLPHIYPVATALFSFAHYVMFALYFHKQQFSIAVSKSSKKQE